jgi:excisionase family DNA binding protein
MEKLEVSVKDFTELKNLMLLGAKTALTMDDAALLTGLSKSHLYKMVCYKKIPHYKGTGGKYTYFSKDELTAWCLHRRVKTTDEVEEDVASRIVSGKPHRIKK